MRQVTRDTLLSALETPQSYEDIASILGCTYHTARRNVNELIDAKLVEELPIRIDNKLQFQVIKGAKDALEIFVPFRSDALTYGQFLSTVAGVGESANAFQKVASMLAYLVQRSYWLERNMGKDEMHPDRRMEGGLPPVAVRAELRRIVDIIHDLEQTLRVIVLRDEVWTEEPGRLYLKSGLHTADVERMHQIAELFFTMSYAQQSTPPRAQAS